MSEPDRAWQFAEDFVAAAEAVRPKYRKSVISLALCIVHYDGRLLSEGGSCRFAANLGSKSLA
jgi:hypothetical protein